jgi:hypothetical protein
MPCSLCSLELPSLCTPEEDLGSGSGEGGFPTCKTAHRLLNARRDSSALRHMMGLQVTVELWEKVIRAWKRGGKAGRYLDAGVAHTAPVTGDCPAE